MIGLHIQLRRTPLYVGFQTRRKLKTEQFVVMISRDVSNDVADNDGRVFYKVPAGCRVYNV